MHKSNVLKNALVVATISAMGFASHAIAAITVDGNLDAAYGAFKSTVSYDASAPTSNFGAPSNTTNAIGYNIFLAQQGANVYGFLKAFAPSVSAGPFANLYFDLDPVNHNGSDLGFEITNKRAFIPGVVGYAAGLAIDYAISADQLNLEFSIPDSYFTGPIAGLTYATGQVFPNAGDSIVLRLSQSFGYSVAGGSSYGVDRLGSLTLPASQVPEPASLLLVGLGLAGVAAARRPKSA